MKRISRHEIKDHRKTARRLSRTLVFAIIGYNLLAFMIRPNDFLNPIDESQRVGHRLSPVRFTDEELQAIRTKYDIRASEAKTVASDPTDVDALLRETFGSEYERAKCITKHESGGRSNTENRGRRKGRYSGECSIGMFQINLASDGCYGKKVHWAKAEGDTLEAKIAWLKVPENNIKVAKQIYDASYWKPWSTYKYCK